MFLKLALFFGFMVCVDLLCGICFNFMLGHAKGGKTGLSSYIDKQASEDILIFGSSRAQHHYDPYMIEDSTGFSCLNCGMDGNGIVAAYARFNQILTRHKPCIVIYDVQPSYDYLVGADNSKYLNAIMPFYDEPFIKEMFDNLCEWQESFKMKSMFYRFNSKVIDYVLDNVTYRDYHKGYTAYKGVLSSVNIEKPMIVEKHDIEIDNGRLALIENFIQEAQKNDVRLFFFVSPSYRAPIDPYIYTPMEELCKKYNVLYKDYGHLDKFDDMTLYQDKGHLNESGARMYTDIVIKEIKEILKQN